MATCEKTAILFEIREFCLHDGPGIRTTLFFKGCPLRCAWCHNPEGLAPEPETLFKENRCRRCGACQDGRLPCPERARVRCGRVWTADELLAEIKPVEDLLNASGGGLTFSGGEPLLQGDFLTAFIERLRAETALHLALETSGWATPEIYQNVVSRVDLVFQDLKHPDPDAHRRWTGVDPAPIFRNLAWLKSSDRPFIARIPLIPGVNDSPAAKEGFARLLTNAPRLERIELLPYHRTAGAKYPFTGRPYAPGFNEAAEPDTDTAPFRAYELPVTVM
jgi:pyruvate formate lyase activating enzyme